MTDKLYIWPIELTLNTPPKFDVGYKYNPTPFSNFGDETCGQTDRPSIGYRYTRDLGHISVLVSIKIREDRHFALKENSIQTVIITTCT
jgi:hypothetical protein